MRLALYTDVRKDGTVEAFEVLSDPVRRRILELIADGERTAGEVAAMVGNEFGLTQPSVSRHLGVLRNNGFAVVRRQGTRRLYRIDAAGPQAAADWLDGLRRAWEQRLDALGTELARGARPPRAGKADTVRRRRTRPLS
jgi:DNA-binding transcriptional ArsR family regulator